MTGIKRRPGIPHEAIAHIVKEAGGTIENYLNGRDSWVRIELSGLTFEAENNTAILIKVLSGVGK